MKIEEQVEASESHASPPPAGPDQKFAPVLCWVVSVLALTFIGLKIIGYGFVPAGDARRHVAHAFVEKPYAQIVVMRPDYKVDHSPGWEWLLRQVRPTTGWDRDALMSFSVLSLLLCVLLAPLPWLRRPEAWLCALLAQLVAIPDLMTRLTQARPYLLTEALLIAILFSWTRDAAKRISWPRIALTSIGISLSVWMHGAWYLWALPVGAFVLARQWRAGFGLAACCAIGVVVGAVLTGRPVAFLGTGLYMATAIYRESTPQWMLVGEFLPSYGEFPSLVMLALVWLWRRGQTPRSPAVFDSPAFWLILISWILGLRADRSWADWGVPAALVWMTQQFETVLPAFLGDLSLKRLVMCGLVAAPLYFQASNDLDRRYTRNLSEIDLDAADPALQGWLPGDGGIFYSADMAFFYNTFYKNPQANWRYILGFEPALMPDEDLKVFRRIQWNHGAFEAYQPWVDKMRPEDRLDIYSPVQPKITELEWRNAGGNIWIGRRPARSQR